MSTTLLTFAKANGFKRISKVVVAGTDTGFPCFFLEKKPGDTTVVMLSKGSAKSIPVGTATATLHDREIRVHEGRPYLVSDTMEDLPS